MCRAFGFRNYIKAYWALSKLRRRTAQKCALMQHPQPKVTGRQIRIALQILPSTSFNTLQQPKKMPIFNKQRNNWTTGKRQTCLNIRSEKCNCHVWQPLIPKQ